MDEREYTQWNQNTPVPAQQEAPVFAGQNDGYQNHKSAPVHEQAYVSPSDDTQPIPIQQPSYSYDYQRYTSQYAAPQYYHHAQTSVSAGTGKTHKTGKGLIAGGLALALLLGFGGGLGGAYLAGSMGLTQEASQTVTATAGGTSAHAETTEGKDSGLTIIESNNSTKTATSIEEVVANVKDSVVEINTETTTYSGFYGQYVTQGAGSGVIISADGYIITNNHVIEDANTITVTLTDGSTYDAKLIGTDATYDVALIKIEAQGLTVATFGSSSDLHLGETSIVIGNPLGQLGGTVTTGIISALDRSIEIDDVTMELLQTDAAINPGNSGGGMFDANGNLIGIVVAKSTTSSNGISLEGLGFAIPIDNVKSILGDLKEKGYVTGRASIGATVVDVLTENSMIRYGVDKTGVYIYSLNDGGAAKNAGLKVGDCILSVGGYKVTSVSSLKAALLKLKAGETADMVVYRDGSEQTFSITFDEATNQNKNDTSDNSNGFNPRGGYDEGDDWSDFFDQYFP